MAPVGRMRLQAKKAWQTLNRLTAPTSSNAYADGLAIATSAVGVSTQAQNVEACTKWSGKILTCKTSAITALLYGQAHNNGKDNVLSTNMIKMSGNRAKQ